MKAFLLASACLLVATAATATATSATAGSAAAGAYFVDLTAWDLASTAAGSQRRAVTVPCTVVGCLVDAGAYDFDPFYGQNLKKIGKAQFAVPWVYNTTFALDVANASAAGYPGAVVLHLDGVNYKATVHVDGHAVPLDAASDVGARAPGAATEYELVGALQRFELDIFPFLEPAAAAHTVVVRVTAPLGDPGHWRNNATDLAMWFDDWNPHPPDTSMGLWRRVRVHVLPAAAPLAVDGLVVHTTVAPASPVQSAMAFLNVSFVVKYFGPPGAPLRNDTFTVDLGAVSEASAARLVFDVVVNNLAPSRVGRRVFLSWAESALLTVDRPRLWWPAQMGAATLFDATVSLAAPAGTGGAAVVLHSHRVGLREMATTLTDGGSLQLLVNGAPLQVRSGGWVPDMFLRADPARARAELLLLKAMGLNSLRLEGMMMFHEFFDITDELGLLVTPGIGCCDGWQHWSQWQGEEFKVAQFSMRAQSRRLGSYASMAFFFLSSDELPPVRVEKMYRAVFENEAWPNPLVSSASQEVSPISGNPGVKMVGPYSWVPPAYWLADGQGTIGGKPMNYGGAWGFLTEGGPGEAPMTYNSWLRTVPAGDVWNASAGGSMSQAWSWHMGDANGFFRNLTYYTPPLLARYGAVASARQYLYRAQAANYEGIRAMFESYSRNKHINATGVVQWQINNAWPSNLWHLFDWYLVAGGGFYGARRACEHVHVMMSYSDGSVWIINSKVFEDANAVSVRVEVLSSAGTVHWTRAAEVALLPGDASTMLTQLTVPLRRDAHKWAAADGVYFVRIEWAVRGEPALLSKTNWYWLSPTMDAIAWDGSNSFRTPCKSWANLQALNALPAPNVTRTSTGRGGGFIEQLQNNSPKNIAFFLHVRLVNVSTGRDVAGAVWSDNFVSLKGGEQKTLLLESAAPPAGEAKVVVEAWDGVVLP
jgi:exo-1,4-beta-D-glucosaminidase